MVVNAECPNCKGRETYYQENGSFYCKYCEKEFNVVYKKSKKREDLINELEKTQN